MFEINVIKEFFYIHPAMDDRVIFDIGAHVGSSVKSFAETGWYAYCFEPDPNNFSELMKNISKFPKVQCYQMAVSNEDASNVPFYLSNEHWGIHSLQAFHKTHQTKITIPTIKLCTFLKNKNIKKFNFLKIDVEGADFLVLQGMNWNDYHPEIVMAEFMDSRTIPYFGYSFHEMVSFMKNNGYATYVFEYEPVMEYGQKGKTTLAPAFLGMYLYHNDISPAWGNLIFVDKLYMNEFEIAFSNEQEINKIYNCKSKLKRLAKQVTRRLIK